jgi:histidinol-phosphate aminotransferase
MTYQPPPAPGRQLRLHLNENTAGCSPAVLAALHAITREDAACYPDYRPVIAKTERWFDVAPGWVLLTNGLDEGLHLVAQAAALGRFRGRVAAPPSVVFPEPAFEMYAACAEAAGLPVIRIAPGPDFAFPLAAMLAALAGGVGLIYLTDPNNPTGLPVPPGAIDAIAAEAPDALVLVDEAYADFAGHTSIGPLLDRRRNVIVGRTFAKGHGLAALRAGALVAHPDTLDVLRALQPPFSLNICAVRALEAALDDRAYLDWYVSQARASRLAIYDFCGRHGLHAWPSEGNFVLVRLGGDVAAVVAALGARGIAVRDRSSAPGCEGCVRVTAGVLAHTRRCLEALEAIGATGTR